MYNIRNASALKIPRSLTNQQRREHAKKKKMQRLWRGNLQRNINDLYYETKQNKTYQGYCAVFSLCVFPLFKAQKIPPHFRISQSYFF